VRIQRWREKKLADAKSEEFKKQRDHVMTTFVDDLNKNLKTGKFRELRDNSLRVSKGVLLTNSQKEFKDEVRVFLAEQKQWNVLSVNFTHFSTYNTLSSIAYLGLPVLPIVVEVLIFTSYIKVTCHFWNQNGYIDVNDAGVIKASVLMPLLQKWLWQ
jgi:hypothetical protein